jgi:hypothetical protein
VSSYLLDINDKIRKPWWDFFDALCAGLTLESAEKNLRDGFDSVCKSLGDTKSKVSDQDSQKTIQGGIDLLNEWKKLLRVWKKKEGMTIDKNHRSAVDPPPTDSVKCCAISDPEQLWDEYLRTILGTKAQRTAAQGGVRAVQVTTKLVTGCVIDEDTKKEYQFCGNRPCAYLPINGRSSVPYSVVGTAEYYLANARQAGSKPISFHNERLSQGVAKVRASLTRWKQRLVPESAREGPAVIQSDFGGNFEVVVREGDQLRHYYRDNNAAGLPWRQGELFGDHVASAPALIQSDFGAPHGNFEVVVREGDQLRHYYRDNAAAGLPWRQGELFGDHVASAPALIQSDFGASHGNFEAVVREANFIRHYWRENNATGVPWHRGCNFGYGVVSAPSLIQSSFKGNFEVVAIIEDLNELTISHVYCNTPDKGYVDWTATTTCGTAGLYDYREVDFTSPPLSGKPPPAQTGGPRPGRPGGPRKG